MFDALILASRLVLAGVFAVAAFTKLADREGARRAVVGFGVPERLATGLALVLPLAELTVAVLLLPSATALAGALGALALLLLFSAAIAVNLIRGREPECHCFGQLHSAPAGAGTLVRNAGLAGVAALVVAGTISGSEPSAVAWIGGLDGTETAVLAIGVAAAALLVAGAIAFTSLLRAHGRVLVRLERVERALADAGLQAGEPAEIPEFGLAPGTPAPPAALDLLRPDLPLLLVFASSGCGPCRELLPKLARWQAEHSDRLTIAVAAPDEVLADAEELGLDHVVVDQGGELFRAFEARGTPSAVLMEPDGSVASRIASGAGQIEALVAVMLDAPRPLSFAP